MSTTLALVLVAAGGGAQELARYEPDPAHPFGRRHPGAPVELEQFAFMIGACDCVDELQNPDGSWTTTDAIWNARWFLNGHAIQDLYWSDTFATTNLRLFDPERGAWFVNFLRAPSNAVATGQWRGGEVATDDGPTMVMWNGSPDGRNGSRLTFHAISERGFRWKAETVVEGEVQGVGWKSTCVRRLPGTELRTPAFLEHEPGPSAPFGRLHPNAPEGTRELAFLLGAFRTESHGADPIAPLVGRAATRSVLNGFGLQHDAWSAGRASSTFFLVDVASGRWRAQRFALPGYEWTVWDGAVVDGRFEAELVLAGGAEPSARETWAIERFDFGLEATVTDPDGTRVTSLERRP